MDKVVEQRINMLEHEVQKMSSELTQIASALNLKTDKNDIINQINISQENIKISADKISIDRRTNIAENSISSSHITNVSGDKISVGSLSEISTNLGMVKTRITDLELANAVIANQEEQIDELRDKVAKLENQDIKINFEIESIDDAGKEISRIMNIHENGPSISRELYTGSLITRKPKQRRCRFWK